MKYLGDTSGSSDFITRSALNAAISDLGLGALAYVDTAVGTFTPAGSVSTQSVSCTPSTANVNSITDVGTLPSWSLVDGVPTFSAGTLPTKGANQNVVTGLGTITVSQAQFTGTQSTVTVYPPST